MPRSLLMKRLLQIGLGLALLGLVGGTSFLAFLAESSPRTALKINPHHPVALMRLAQETLARVDQKAREAERASDPPSWLAGFAARSGTSGTVSEESDASEAMAEQRAALLEARGMLEMAIRADPLSYRALTLLGRTVELLAEMAEGTTDAAPYYEMAERLSPHATDAIYWLLRRDVEAGNYGPALRRSDILLRTSSRAGPAVLPMLARLAEIPTAAEMLQELLSTSPPWRPQFFAALPRHLTDARTPLSLLLGLKATAHPPAEQEIRGYLDFLLQRNLYDLAYYTWLQFLPEDRLESVGLLFNGGFQAKPTGMPFDWAMRAGAGATAEVVQLPDERDAHVLRIAFTSGRVQFGGVYQTVMLAPGTYLLSGRVRGELIGKRGLRWRVSCLGPKPQRIGEGDMHLGPIPAWRTFDLAFVVPPTDCPALQVRLVLDARSTSEQLVMGTMFYDDLKLERAPESTR